ncbi:hypothetical protein SprV_0100289300 [Sparganum proliferum]
MVTGNGKKTHCLSEAGKVLPVPFLGRLRCLGGLSDYVSGESPPWQVGILALLLEALVFAWASFLRPPFVVFVLPFAILQLYNFIKNPNRWRIFLIHIPLSAAAAIVVGLMLVYFDTQHFTPHAHMSEPGAWVVTPLRFLRYNSAKENLAEHGLHPWYAYIFIHWPLMAGLIPLLSSLESAEAATNKPVDVTIFYKTYMPPRFPFGVPSNRSLDFHSCLNFPPHELICPSIIDLAGRPASDLFSLLECIKSRAHGEVVLRLVMPGTVALRNVHWYDLGDLLLTEKFFPHISTENLPKITLPRCFSDNTLADCLSTYWTELVSQASLYSYIIRLNNRS